MIDLILLQKIFNVYSWLVASFVMIFIAAIANFYQKKFGIRTFYYFYLAPIIVLLIPAFQLFPYFTFLAELIEFIGAIGSFLASFYLYIIMVGVKK